MLSQHSSRHHRHLAGQQSGGASAPRAQGTLSDSSSRAPSPSITLTDSHSSSRNRSSALQQMRHGTTMSRRGGAVLRGNEGMGLAAPQLAGNTLTLDAGQNSLSCSFRSLPPLEPATLSPPALSVGDCPSRPKGNIDMKVGSTVGERHKSTTGDVPFPDRQTTLVYTEARSTAGDPAVTSHPRRRLQDRESEENDATSDKTVLATVMSQLSNTLEMPAISHRPGSFHTPVSAEILTTRLASLEEPLTWSISERDDKLEDAVHTTTRTALRFPPLMGKPIIYADAPLSRTPQGQPQPAMGHDLSGVFASARSLHSSSARRAGASAVGRAATHSQPLTFGDSSCTTAELSSLSVGYHCCSKALAPAASLWTPQYELPHFPRLSSLPSLAGEGSDGSEAAAPERPRGPICYGVVDGRNINKPLHLHLAQQRQVEGLNVYGERMDTPPASTPANVSLWSRLVRYYGRKEKLYAPLPDGTSPFRLQFWSELTHGLAWFIPFGLAAPLALVFVFTFMTHYTSLRLCGDRCYCNMLDSFVYVVTMGWFYYLPLAAFTPAVFVLFLAVGQAHDASLALLDSEMSSSHTHATAPVTVRRDSKPNTSEVCGGGARRQRRISGHSATPHRNPQRTPSVDDRSDSKSSEKGSESIPVDVLHVSLHMRPSHASSPRASRHHRRPASSQSRAFADMSAASYSSVSLHTASHGTPSNVAIATPPPPQGRPLQPAAAPCAAATARRYTSLDGAPTENRSPCVERGEAPHAAMTAGEAQGTPSGKEAEFRASAAPGEQRCLHNFPISMFTHHTVDPAALVNDDEGKHRSRCGRYAARFFALLLPPPLLACDGGGNASPPSIRSPVWCLPSAARTTVRSPVFWTLVVIRFVFVVVLDTQLPTTLKVPYLLYGFLRACVLTLPLFLYSAWRLLPLLTIPCFLMDYISGLTLVLFNPTDANESADFGILAVWPLVIFLVEKLISYMAVGALKRCSLGVFAHAGSSLDASLKGLVATVFGCLSYAMVLAAAALLCVECGDGIRPFLPFAVVFLLVEVLARTVAVERLAVWLYNAFDRLVLRRPSPSSEAGHSGGDGSSEGTPATSGASTGSPHRRGIPHFPMLPRRNTSFSLSRSEARHDTAGHALPAVAFTGTTYASIAARVRGVCAATAAVVLSPVFVFGQWPRDPSRPMVKETITDPDAVDAHGLPLCHGYVAAAGERGLAVRWLALVLLLALALVAEVVFLMLTSVRDGRWRQRLQRSSLTTAEGAVRVCPSSVAPFMKDVFLLVFVGWFTAAVGVSTALMTVPVRVRDED